MRTRLLTAGIALVFVAAAAPISLALAPMWELDVNTAHPQVVRIKTPERDEAYWFVTYTVKNQFAEPKGIQPKVTLTDNMGQVLHDVYEPAVLDAVKKRTGLELANVTNAAGTLEPNKTLRAVAVFGMPDREASRLTVSIYGAACKRVETQKGKVGIASRVHKVVYSTDGDRYNFTPDRLETKSRGFVSTFRTFDSEGKELGEAAEAEPMKLIEATEETVDVPAVGAVAPADPLDLLPGNLKGLGYVDFRQLAGLGLIDKLFELMPEEAKEEGKDPAELLKMINLDPSKDLDAMAIGFKDFGEEQGRPHGSLVITGRFDRDAIYKTIEELKTWGEAESVTYQGYELWQEGDGDVRGVLDGKCYVDGTGESVKKVIDIYKGDAKGGARSSPLMARVKDLQNETFWFTADVEIPPMGEEGPGAAMAMMMPGLDPSKIKAITLSGKVTQEDFNLKTVLGCMDEDSAAAMIGGLKQGVNMMAGMSGMVTADDPEAQKAVGELIKAIKISGEGSSASIDLTVTAELAEKLKKLGQKLSEMQKGGPPGGGEIEFEEEDFDLDEE